MNTIYTDGPLAKLHPRQVELVHLLAQGYTSHKQLERQMTIAPGTVCKHIQQIHAALGTSTLAQVALIAVACGVPLATPEQIVERSNVQ